MGEQSEQVDRRSWLLARLDKALARRHTLRIRYQLFEELAGVNGDDNANAWKEQTRSEGVTINEEISELTRRLLELPE